MSKTNQQRGRTVESAAASERQQQLLHEAVSVARESLRACYDKEGIVAGRTHFNDYWARDSFWASLGALALGDSDIVRTNLRLFSRYQRRNGQIPLRVARYNQWWRFYGFRRPYSRLQPFFQLVERAGHPIDPTALYLIALAEYVAETNDQRLARELWPNAQRALSWLRLQDHDHDGLIESGYLSDWMDSILRRGKVAYTNVVFWQAIRAAGSLATRLKEQSTARELTELAELVCARIQRVFWTGHGFTEWQLADRRGQFSTDANVLAMLWGLASPAQARSIDQTIARRHLATGGALKTLDYEPTIWQRTYVHTLYLIGDYHTYFRWPWLGIVWAIAHHRQGATKRALHELATFAEWFVRDGVVGEIYAPNGTLGRRRTTVLLTYHSERPFAWQAGLFLVAARELGFLHHG